MVWVHRPNEAVPKHLLSSFNKKRKEKKKQNLSIWLSPLNCTFCNFLFDFKFSLKTGKQSNLRTIRWYLCLQSSMIDWYSCMDRISMDVDLHAETLTYWFDWKSFTTSQKFRHRYMGAMINRDSMFYKYCRKRFHLSDDPVGNCGWNMQSEVSVSWCNYLRVIPKQRPVCLLQ